MSVDWRKKERIKEIKKDKRTMRKQKEKSIKREVTVKIRKIDR